MSNVSVKGNLEQCQNVFCVTDLGRAGARALDIDIDVYEALMRMNSGFTPSREDLRGSWLSLATFKERLASIPSSELLLRSAAGTLTKIGVADDGRVLAEVTSS